MIARDFVGGLRPHGHERAVRSVEHQEVFVAAIERGAVKALRGINDVVRLAALDFPVENLFNVGGLRARVRRYSETQEGDGENDRRGPPNR